MPRPAATQPNPTEPNPTEPTPTEPTPTGTTEPDERAFDVVVVGSANLDLVATVDELPGPGESVRATTYAEHAGGKGLNQAVACARMGARTAFVGCVGDDPAGAALRAVLEAEGVDVSGLAVVDEPTGRAMVVVDAHGENSIVVVAGANARLDPTVADTLPTARVVLVQLEIPLATVAAVTAAARQAGALVVLNPAPAAPLPAEVLACVDVLTPNAGELDAIGGTARLHAAGVATVITTRGADGVELSEGGAVSRVDAHRVSPVDTVGAGDAFSGALCAELAAGLGLHDAVATALVAGALATTVRGAVPSLPTRTAVDAAVRPAR